MSSPSRPFVFVFGKCKMENLQRNLATPQVFKQLHDTFYFKLTAYCDVIMSSPMQQQPENSIHPTTNMAASNKLAMSRCLQSTINTDSLFIHGFMSFTLWLSGFSQSNAHQPLTDWSLTLILSWLYCPSLGNHQPILTSNPHPQCYDSDSAQGHSTEQLYSSSDAVGAPQLDLWG